MVNSRYPRFSATLLRSSRKGLHVPRAHLLPKLRCHFAEFLKEGSLKRLGIFFPPTCVGFRYGHHRSTLCRSFSWKQRIVEFTSARRSPHHLSALDKGPFVARSLLVPPPTGLNRAIHQPGSITFLRPSYRNSHGGAGILTCFPSPTPFGLGLGTD